MYSRNSLNQIAPITKLDRLMEIYAKTGVECIKQFIETGEKDWYFAGFSAREDYLEILAEIEKRERRLFDIQPSARWLNSK